MKEPFRTLVELGIITVAGLTLGLGANQLNPKELKLSRDYFAAPAMPHPAPQTGTSQPTNASDTGQADPTNHTNNANNDDHLALLEEWDLTAVDFDRAVEIYEDPYYADEVHLFIDARDDDAYAEGHVPGALQFDRYYPENYLDSILSASQAATVIVIYCNGGQCEDSAYAAIELFDQGVDSACTFIYVGGITDWRANGMPVEQGERHSGNIVQGSQP